MNRYIETSEATAVIADYFDLICDTEYGFDETEILRRMNANAVDAVPVIRCKDCKYWHEKYRHGVDMSACKRAIGYFGVNDYCSKAERKDV